MSCGNETHQCLLPSLACLPHSPCPESDNGIRLCYASFLVCSVQNKGSPSAGAFISKHVSSRPTRCKQNLLCLHRQTKLALESSTFPNCRDLKRPRSCQPCPLNHSPQEKASWVTPSQLLRTQQGEPPGQEPRPFHQDISGGQFGFSHK